MKVVLIVGSTRSGSTVLDLVLGRHKDAVSAGELRFIWRRGIIEKQLCGCGKPLKQCDFWTSVFKENDELQLEIAARQREKVLNRVERLRHMPRLWFDHFAHGSKLLSRYVEQEWRLLEAISCAAGCNVVVDSSKYPGRALALEAGTTGKREIFIVHLVRDPRAVAFAWTKKKLRPEITHEVSFMPTYPVAYSAAVWIGVNIAAETLRLAVGRQRFLRLRYEDLVRDPERMLPKLGSFLDLKDSLRDAFSDASEAGGIAHTVSGNPVRFQPVTNLSSDDHWKIQMSSRDKNLVAMITFPLLMKYGYRLGTSDGF